MQPDILEYSKLKEWILKAFSLTAQQRVDRLISLTAQLEQQHDVTPSQVWQEINSLMTLPDGKKINYAQELWQRCLHPAVRATTSSTMVDPTEDQLDKADQHAAILTSNPPQQHSHIPVCTQYITSNLLTTTGNNPRS